MRKTIAELLEALLADPVHRAKIEAYFERRVRRTPTHWYWSGSYTGNYGKATFSTATLPDAGRKTVTILAHRLSLAMHEGIFRPEVVAHLCDVTGCVNPMHLIASTHLENAKHRTDSQNPATREPKTNT